MVSLVQISASWPMVRAFACETSGLGLIFSLVI